MGYRLVNTDHLGIIWSQRTLGESNRSIARRLGLDRGTVNRYAEAIDALAIPPDTPLAEVRSRLSVLGSVNAKGKPARAVLEPLEEEIRSLLAGDRTKGALPMKAKTAWLVIQERHGLGERPSYESFKRFVRDRRLDRKASKATVRIEVEPGDEIQVDYAKMGGWVVAGKSRTIYAFIGILSFSRLPFVLFGPSQDEVSFAKALAAMLSCYGGSARRINLDNLKAGVLAAGIFDPVLNRTFAELCDHYGILPDPARPASPKDKGKVERIVPVVRELWKRLTALHPAASLEELNELARAWARDDYGKRCHGTTGAAPVAAFEGVERALLAPLPPEPFEPASWTVAKVNPDQFIRVGKRLYGLPALYIGKRVAVRSTDTLVEIYFEHKLVRSYPVTDALKSYLTQDFPAHGQPFVPGAYARSLIVKAREISPQAAEYLRLMLKGGGNLSLRRAQACLSVLQSRKDCPALSHVLGYAIAHQVFKPDALKVLFEDESRQRTLPFPISPCGAAMGRDVGYYVGP